MTTIVGTEGSDTLNGTDDADLIGGFGGNDSIAAGGGNDQVIGGTGNDTILGEAGDDLLLGQTGSDGGAGADTLIGQFGDDLYVIDDIGDVAIENAGEGRDTVYASLSYTLGDGEVEDLALLGAGNLNATGNAIANALFGNGGDNSLTGRAGAATLVGGAGADAFVYAQASAGGDTITDFVHGVDHIQVSAAGFGGGLAMGGPAPLASGSTPTSVAASFLYDTDDGRLYWDADGTGGTDPVLVATLQGAPTLTDSDFIIGG